MLVSTDIRLFFGTWILASATSVRFRTLTFLKLKSLLLCALAKCSAMQELAASIV